MSDLVKRIQIICDDSPPQTLIVDDSSEVCISLVTTVTKQLAISITRRYTRNQRIIFVNCEQKTFEL